MSLLKYRFRYLCLRRLSWFQDVRTRHPAEVVCESDEVLNLVLDRRDGLPMLSKFQLMYINFCRRDVCVSTFA